MRDTFIRSRGHRPPDHPLSAASDPRFLLFLGAFTPGTFPALDTIPPTNSPQVLAWIQEVANSGVTIPTLSATTATPDNPCTVNAALAADTSRCWWTCGGCTRQTDIVSCPDKDTWGVSYDDGPSDYTADLLNYMDDVKLKSTFFVVGSRVGYPGWTTVNLVLT